MCQQSVAVAAASPEAAPCTRLEPSEHPKQQDQHTRSAAETPALNTRPAILLADNRVIQRNLSARERGIHIGTSLAAAHSIASDLIHMQRDSDRELERLRYLSQVLYGFSSHVSIDSVPGGYLDDPGSMHHSVVLEISASLRLFGGLRQLLQQVHQQIHALQHQAVLQVAHTPLAALCAARWQHQRHPIEETSAPSRSAESGSPHRLPVVVPNDLSVLADMPLDCLALTARQGESLHNMGVRTCGALLRLPGKELGQRFGKDLKNYLNRLTGAQPDPRPPIAPPQEFGSAVHLLEACTSKTALLFPVKRLCHELSHWLIAQQLGVCLLRWEFSNHADAPVTLLVRTTRACQRGDLLLQLTQLHLERCELPRDVLNIKLRGLELEPWQNHSDSLFPHMDTGAGQSASAEPLTGLLDQLRARLGNEVCNGVSIQHRHQPELAWQFKPLQHINANARTTTAAKRRTAPQNPSAVEALKGQGNGASGKHRPTWLLPTPRPIPRRALNLLHGPERLQGGWWQDQRMRRDYYIAQTHQQKKHGSYSWVFCEGSCWYVHGYFG